MYCVKCRKHTETLQITTFVSEMTYNVSMGTLNPAIPYHTARRTSA